MAHAVGSRRAAMRALGEKAWRESRGRFLLAAAAIAALVVGFIALQGMFRAHLGEASPAERSYAGYVYLRIYAGFVRGLFTVLALLLGLGGLNRERGQGTIGFTLALPVTRLEHFAARVLVGLGEIVALALLPLLLVPVVSRLVGESYPVGQCVAFAGLWIAGGSALFAFAVLVSATVRSEYVALTVALVSYFLYPLAVVYAPPLRGRPLHIHYIMNGRGMPYLDSSRDLFVGPFPWAIVGGVAIVAVVMLASAATATRRQDFA